MNMNFIVKAMDNNIVLSTFLTVLLACFFGMVTTFYFVNIHNSEDEKYLEHITQMRLKVQQITQYAASAANGKEESFKDIGDRLANFQQHLTVVRDGDTTAGSPATPEEIQEDLDALQVLWEGPEGLKNSINALLGTKDAVIKLYEQKPLLVDLTKELEAQTNAVITNLNNAGADSSQTYAATNLLMIFERINNNIRLSFKGDEDALEADQQLGKDTEIFLATVNALLGEGAEEAPIEPTEPFMDEGPMADMPPLPEEEGDDMPPLPEEMEPLAEEASPTTELIAMPSPLTDAVSKQSVRRLKDMFENKDQTINEFLDTSEQLFNAKDAYNFIFETSPLLLDEIENLQGAYQDLAGRRLLSPFLGAILAVFVFILLLILLVAIVVVNNARAEEARLRLDEQLKTNQRNQEAILRLLSEISDLADGDLTIIATVTEDFTGAIADALNFSIDSLRELVITINSTAGQVTQSAHGSRQIATQLTEASERQAQQIAKASQAIIGMANSVKKVSANAIESAEVAKKSVEIAGKGAKAVQDTIAGMDNIREQIQETSKRIKRLGESSQEIGEIVGLIDDIADQTNILALNAAIQAAMAGESGRGFAVVADEVQRLAERAGNATKQIDALVKTIQSDTNEAVSSMEQSTSNVVEGAKIAESAGEALIEIETVSVKLAGQIENIAQTTRTQAAVASNISGSMTIIQEITTQASKGTNETAAAIEQLAEQATQLKDSVSGFKLPEGSLDNS